MLLPSLLALLRSLLVALISSVLLSGFSLIFGRRIPSYEARCPCRTEMRMKISYLQAKRPQSRKNVVFLFLQGASHAYYTRISDV
jgi:hypothetical protein